MTVKCTQQLIILIGSLLLLATCRRTRDVQPLDDYYGFLEVDSLELKLLGNRKAEVILGVTKDSLRFLSTGYNKEKSKILNGAYTYWANGKPLSSNTFLPDEEGEYKVVAKLGRNTSEPILVKAIDPVKQVSAVKLKLGFTHGELIADDLSMVILHADVLDATGQTVNFDYKSALIFYVNNQVYTDTLYRTSKPGNYSFKVGIFGKMSESIQVKALTPTEANIVTMPIIFHLFNVDISQAKLQAQIDILNKTFRDNWNPNSYPKDTRHADFRLRFVLAGTGPDGKSLPMPGRDYIDAGKKQYHSDETMGDLGWKHYWNPDYYINAFVADYSNDIYGGVKWAAAGSYPAVSQSFAGMDVYPKGSKPAFLHSMHIRHFVFDDPTSPAMTHEVGHMLALYHTFNLANCNGDSDYCEDTYVYNQGAQILSDAHKVVTCNGPEVFPTNYMDYAGAFNSFTVDQSTRARHVINHGLWLPTSFNGRSLGGGRKSAAPGYVQRPAVIANVKPVACAMPANPSKAFGWPTLR